MRDRRADGRAARQHERERVEFEVGTRAAPEQLQAHLEDLRALVIFVARGRGRAARLLVAG